MFNLKIKNKFKELRPLLALSPEEKIKSEERLMAFADLHQTSSTNTAYTMPYFLLAHPALSTAVILMIVIGASVSYAAEDSLPNEILYPVKTNFNEQILIVSASLTPEDKRDEIYNTLIDRRLKEAELLLANRQLDKDVVSDLQDTVTVLVDNVKKKAESHRDEDNLLVAHSLSSDLENILEGHAVVLTEIVDVIDPAEEQLMEVTNLLNQVTKEGVEAESLRSSVEGEIVKNMDEEEIVYIRDLSEEVAAKISTASSSLSRYIKEDGDSDFTQEVLESLSGIRGDYIKSLEMIESGDNNEAFKLLNSIYQETERLNTQLEVTSGVNEVFEAI